VCDSGIVSFLCLPTISLLVPVLRLHSYIAQNRAQLFSARQRETSFREARRRFSQSSGLLAKIKIGYLFFEERLAKGDWDDSDPKIRFWSFLVSDYTVGAWMFALWVLVKKLWIMLAIHIQDEATNAGMALACQMTDSILVLIVRPYVETSTDLVKAISEVSNMLTYLVVTLPILSGVKPSEWMGDLTQIVMSLAATTIATIAAMKAPLTALIKMANQALSTAACCFTTPAMGGILADTRNQTATIALTNLNDETKDQLMEKLHHHSAKSMDMSGPAEQEIRSLPAPPDLARSLREGLDRTGDDRPQGLPGTISGEEEERGIKERGRGGSLSRPTVISVESHSEIRLEGDLCFTVPLSHRRAHQDTRSSCLWVSGNGTVQGDLAARSPWPEEQSPEAHQNEDNSGRISSFYGISRNVPVLSSGAPRNVGRGSARKEGNPQQEVPRVRGVSSAVDLRSDNGVRLPQRAILFSSKQHTRVDVVVRDLAQNSMGGYSPTERWESPGGGCLPVQGRAALSVGPTPQISPQSANNSGDFLYGRAEWEAVQDWHQLEVHSSPEVYEHWQQVHPLTSDLSEKMFARRFIC